MKALQDTPIKCMDCNYNGSGSYCKKLEQPLRNGFAMLHYSSACGESLSKRQFQVLKHFGYPIAKKVLDVGCGHRKKGSVGIDYSRDSVADIICDAHFLPFKNNVFDKVVSTCVLEHSYNPYSFLKEQSRVLREKGLIECTTDNAQFYLWSVFKVRHEDYHEDHYMIFYPKNVSRLMTQAGFKVTRFNYIPRLEPRFKGKLLKTIIKLFIRTGFLFRPDCVFYRFKFEGKK